MKKILKLSLTVLTFSLSAKPPMEIEFVLTRFLSELFLQLGEPLVISDYRARGHRTRCLTQLLMHFADLKGQRDTYRINNAIGQELKFLNFPADPDTQKAIAKTLEPKLLEILSSPSTQEQERAHKREKIIGLAQVKACSAPSSYKPVAKEEEMKRRRQEMALFCSACQQRFSEELDLVEHLAQDHGLDKIQQDKIIENAVAVLERKLNAQRKIV